MNIDNERIKKFLGDMEEKINWQKENGCKLLDCKTIDNNIELRLKNIKLRKELETYKKIAEKLAEEVKRDSVFYDSKGISSCDLSEEKYCKCSKHNNGANCKQCIIDWAKREVENEIHS